MVEAIENTHPEAAIATLRAAGVVPLVAERLAGSAGSITGALHDVIVDEVSAFTDSGNPDVLPELQQHLALHVSELRRLLAGESPGRDPPNLNTACLLLRCTSLAQDVGNLIQSKRYRHGERRG